VINRYVGNLPPMPGVFPDYPAPVVRNAGSEREMVMMRWGMPPPPRAGGYPVTNIRNTSSAHWRAWLKPESRGPLRHDKSNGTVIGGQSCADGFEVTVDFIAARASPLMLC
jgi:hypothetical protein